MDIENQNEERVDQTCFGNLLMITLICVMLSVPWILFRESWIQFLARGISEILD
jgi:hypothetical protein